MNKITPSLLNIERSAFQAVLRSLFDDTFEISSEYSKHSACNVELGAHVDLEWATEIVSKHGLLVEPTELVGTWMIYASSDYSWGIEWSMVDEAVQVKEVTETVTTTVTSWKPLSDETVPTSN